MSLSSSYGYVIESERESVGKPNTLPTTVSSRTTGPPTRRVRRGLPRSSGRATVSARVPPAATQSTKARSSASPMWASVSVPMSTTAAAAYPAS